MAVAMWLCRPLPTVLVVGPQPFPRDFPSANKNAIMCLAHTSYPDCGQGIDRACSRSLEAATWGWGEAVQGAEKPVRPQPLTAGPLPSVRESHVQSLLPRSHPDTAGPADVAPNLVTNSVLVAESTKLLLLRVRVCGVRCSPQPWTEEQGTALAEPPARVLGSGSGAGTRVRGGLWAEVAGRQQRASALAARPP